LWKPGQSGNPGGRPKIEARIRAKAARESPKAWERLVTLSKSADEKIALEANKAILQLAGIALRPAPPAAPPMVQVNVGSGATGSTEAFDGMSPGAIHGWLVSNTHASPEDFERARAALERHAAAEAERRSAVDAEVIEAPAVPADRTTQPASDPRVEPAVDDGLSEWRALGAAAAAQPAATPDPAEAAPPAPPPQELTEEDFAARARPDWGRE
jgi:hypothetical protein